MIVCNSLFQNVTDSTESLGVTVLKSRGFSTDAHWYWIGAGALLGFIFVFNFFYTLCLNYLNRGCLYLLCIETPKNMSLVY